MKRLRKTGNKHLTRNWGGVKLKCEWMISSKISLKGGEKDEEKRIHADRIAGSHRNNSDTCRDAATGAVKGKGKSADGILYQQLQADITCHQDVFR
jgi:hypothetical protein